MWVRIDDSFGDDPRIVTAGPLAVGVLVLMLCYSNRNLSDGWVPAAAVRRMLFEGSTGEAEGKQNEAISCLLQLCFIKSVPRDGIVGYQIDEAYVRLQPSREETLRQRGERSLQKAEAGRLGGIKSGQARRKQTRSRREADVKHEASTTEAPFPFPIPSEKITDAGASVHPPEEPRTQEPVSHAVLCAVYARIVRAEPESSQPDRFEAFKVELARQGVHSEREALYRAVDAVDKVESLRLAGERPRRQSEFVRVGVGAR